MAPYFQTVKSFADVPLDGGISTREFLQASDGLVQLFDLLGVGVFSFVQTDMRNNIHGVRERFKEAESSSLTLEQLVKSGGKNFATACVVRLIRGLLFTCRALQEMQKDKTAELHVCFNRSYEVVLRHHHSFMVRQVIYVALRAVPTRQTFYSRIAQGEPHDKLDTELAKWLAALDTIVVRMKSFLADGGWGNV